MFGFCSMDCTKELLVSFYNYFANWLLTLCCYALPRRVGMSISQCTNTAVQYLSIPPTPVSVINSAQYTYRKSDFPYTNDLRENTYILLFPSSSLHNLVSFNIWRLYCLDCSISLNLRLVTMLWFKWWDSKILCGGNYYRAISCKSLNFPPS